MQSQSDDETSERLSNKQQPAQGKDQDADEDIGSTSVRARRSADTRTAANDQQDSSKTEHVGRDWRRGDQSALRVVQDPAAESSALRRGKRKKKWKTKRRHVKVLLLINSLLFVCERCHSCVANDDFILNSREDYEMPTMWPYVSVNKVTDADWDKFCTAIAYEPGTDILDFEHILPQANFGHTVYVYAEVIKRSTIKMDSSMKAECSMGVSCTSPYRPIFHPIMRTRTIWHRATKFGMVSHDGGGKFLQCQSATPHTWNPCWSVALSLQVMCALKSALLVIINY